MLAVQEYLNSGKSLDDLYEEFGVLSTHDISSGLVILNYGYDDSNKTHPIVKECRALVLDFHNNFALVARSFPRFFNLGEVENDPFDFSDFYVQDKQDGSLILIYYYPRLGKWFISTRKTFAQMPIPETNFTWEALVLKCLDTRKDDLHTFLNPDLTYVCELCSPYNRIVTPYADARLYLITAFRGEQELSYDELMTVNTRNRMKQIDTFCSNSLEQVCLYVDRRGQECPTYEGVVIRDSYNNRLKIKNKMYLRLHKLKTNGDLTPKHFFSMILDKDDDDFVSAFPEFNSEVQKYRERIVNEFSYLSDFWERTKSISNQKDFALAIKDYPLKHILFAARANNTHPMNLIENFKEKFVEYLCSEEPR